MISEDLYESEDRTIFIIPFFAGFFCGKKFFNKLGRRQPPGLNASLGGCCLPIRRRIAATRRSIMLRKRISILLVLFLVFTLVPLGSVKAQGDDPCQDPTPRIAVVSAFSSELTLLLEEADIEAECVLTGVTYSVGTLRGSDVVMFLSGVSMVNAAMTTERAINHFNVERIVFSGIAGGVNPDLNIGDVVVPRQFGQYLESTFVREINGEFSPRSDDPPFANYGMMYPEPTSYTPPGGEPDEYVPTFWFPADEEMLAVAQRLDLELECTPEDVCLTYEPKLVVGGNGVSGQSFVDNAEFREYVWETFEADALEMETAAVAHVAASHDVPYLAFRSLSDLAGGGEGENEIGTFFQLASDNSARVLLAYLEAWAAR